MVNALVVCSNVADFYAGFPHPNMEGSLCTASNHILALNTHIHIDQSVWTIDNQSVVFFEE